MNPKLKDILKKFNWSEEYQDKLLEAIEAIAFAYDVEYDSYPEHKYEGLTLLLWCQGKDKLARDKSTTTMWERKAEYGQITQNKTSI